MSGGFWETVWYAFGIVAGLAAALGLALTWTIQAGPLYERFLEGRERPGTPSEPVAATVGATGLYTIVVSDIHLDTWDYEKGETHRAFGEFMDWVRGHPRIGDLIVNGDILDVPTHPLNQRDVTMLTVGLDGTFPDLEGGELGVVQDRFEPLLQALGGIFRRDDDAPSLRVSYLTGNHDLGLSGLRYIRPATPWTSFKILWNPSILFQIAPGREIYVEHGHRADPYLWLYLRYAALELVRGPATNEAQRGGKVGMGPNADERGELPLDAHATQSWEADGPSIVPPKGEDASSMRARYRYRHAARRMFRNLPLSVRTVTMGHTHIPDRYTFPDGRTYLNSGDWAGNSAHRSFLVVRPDGRVTGPHQWRGAADGERALGSPAAP